MGDEKKQKRKFPDVSRCTVETGSSEKAMKKIKQLEKTIKKCRQKIKELEEEEVNLDNEDSPYIKLDIYQRHLVKLCNYLSKINGDTSMRKQIFKKKIRRINIPNEMTGIPFIDEAILNKINSSVKKINKMEYLETQSYAGFVAMPDYKDILQCIQQCNTTNNLNFSDEKLNALAKKALLAVGNYMKTKRMEGTEEYMQFLSDGQYKDPATNDIELENKLQRNKIRARKELEDQFQMFVDVEDDLKIKGLEKEARGATKDVIESNSENKEEPVGEPDNSANNSDDKHSKFEETSQVIDEFASVKDNVNDLDDIIEVDHPIAVNKLFGTKIAVVKTETRPNKIMQPTIRSVLPQIHSQVKSVSHNSIKKVSKQPVWIAKKKDEPIVVDLT